MARKLATCDGCGKERRDVRAVGRDANGDAEAPDLCFLCRVEGERGKVYNVRYGGYVYVDLMEEFNRLCAEIENPAKYHSTED